MSELIHAIYEVERIADLIERGRSDDASREFVASDCHVALIQALNTQRPGHMDKPLGQHLNGLLLALKPIIPNPHRPADPEKNGPADPKKIRSYCQDIKGQVPGGGVAPKREKEPAPSVYLLNWRGILAALDLKNNKEDRYRVRSLNDKFGGPIIPGGKGGQPKANKVALLEWWNRLEVEFADRANQAKGSFAEASTQHDYGRTGVAAPEISGEIKRSRKDRAL